MVKKRQIIGANTCTILNSVIEMGLKLSAVEDQRKVLHKILHEARKLVLAEAGTVYVVNGKTLRLASVQNDQLSHHKIAHHLLDKELPISYGSLAGFTFLSGQTVNITDTLRLPAGSPFSIYRGFDQSTGYNPRTILAIPIKSPTAECLGVLELFNALDSRRRPTRFRQVEKSGLPPLVSLAAVTMHNSLLQSQLREAHRDTIIRLSIANEFRDDDTGNHVRRISDTCAIIARRMGIGSHVEDVIRFASPMHDIGKIGISDQILRKPGPLTVQQRLTMQQHTLIGAAILAEAKNEMIAMAHDIAISHHERWDGKGYPNGLAGENIPLSGRIACIADVFDALLSKRCYKDAYPLEKAVDIIRQGRGRQFDPNVADAFFTGMPEILHTCRHISNPARLIA